MKIILSIDIGTTSICALALDAESRKVLHSQTLSNGTDVQGLPIGHHEQDPALILQIAERAVDGVIQSLIQQEISRNQICGMVVTGQVHGIILLDKTNTPKTNLITWRDQRSELSSSTGLAVNAAARCGCSLQSGYGLTTLHHLIETDVHLREALLAGDVKVVGITDFIIAKLSGRVTTDTSMAASWGGFDLALGEWDKSVLKQLDIPQKALPEVVPSATACGQLVSQYAKRWGLDTSVTICAGIGDHQAAAMSCAPLQHGSCIINIGTGGQVSIVRKGYTFIEGLETRPLIDDYFLLAGTSLCGGWSYAYLADFFGKVINEFTGENINAPELLEIMNRIGTNSANDAEGLIFDTGFLGSRIDKNGLGSIHNINTQNLTPKNLIRSAVKGMADELFEYHQLANIPVTSLMPRATPYATIFYLGRPLNSAGTKSRLFPRRRKKQRAAQHFWRRLTSVSVRCRNCLSTRDLKCKPTKKPRIFGAF